MDKKKLEEEKKMLEKDLRMIDDTMSNNTFIVFSNIKGKIIKPETRSEDGKWHFFFTFHFSHGSPEEVL